MTDAPLAADPRSHGLWERTAPPPPPTTPLSGGTQAEVAIVGGGYTGLSAGLHLAEAGVRVVLLEGMEIGFGGAGRNVGLINAGLWLMPDDVPGILGEIHGERVLRLLGGGPREVMALIARHGIECELTTSGTLHLAVGKAGKEEIEAREAQWQRRGAPVRVLSAGETAAWTGARGYAGALLDERAGTLQPLAYARGLARAAIAAGVTIHTRSPVQACDASGKGWVLRTPGGELAAERIIVATDAYSTGPWASVRAEQLHLPYFNFATEPVPEALRATILPGRQGCWDTKEVMTSFRLDARHRLVFGSVGALRGTGTAIHRSWARRALAKLYPALAGLGFECEWHGQIGMTSDAVPRLHRFADSIIGVSGYNGRGISPGTMFGRVLADHLLGRLPDVDLPLPVTPMQSAPWRAAKEAWYEYGAQAAHLAADRL
ncbi:NAD(P)/FAD-dependent oxidoreductase [Falsiroseomonas sp. HW251]|uniref:NAD(P)/FAD-dependent oxidoreductase n=1 Tax=Falsiroseomonas sp. HW251 TaxID=3390998 RepID=UPI003D321806